MTDQDHHVQADSDELNAPPRDRRDLLRRAADPATPVAALLDLATEFPEQVASNPSLPLALAADPSCIDDVGAVALACLLTSPALPPAVAETIRRLARGPDRAPYEFWVGAERLRIVEEYLDAWTKAGSKMLAVDVSAVAPSASGVPAEVERMTRGQALLARRLGWPGCSSWYTKCDYTEPLVRVHASAGEDQRSEIRIFWPNWSSVGPSECFWSLHPARPSHVRLSWSKEPGQADATFCLDSCGDATASILFTTDSGEEDHWELSVDPGVTKAATGSFAELRRFAEEIAPGRFVVTIGGKFAVGDAARVTEGLNSVLDLNGPGRDEDGEEDDETTGEEDACEDVDDGGSARQSPDVVRFVRKLCPMEGSWFTFDDGAPLLKCLESASDHPRVAALGGRDAIAQACQSAFERLIPPASAQTAGREVLSMEDGQRESELVICDGSGTLILCFFGFRWCASCEEHEVQLDGVIDGPR